MTLRHFQIFKMVAETNNFTKAAQKLYMSQSGVSHAIHEMEEKAGTLLFERLSKQVCLTKSGALLLEEIIPIVSSCEALEAHLTCLEKEAPIHIASSITIASFWLPEILCTFEKKWNNTPIEVEVVSAANAAILLHTGSADLALIEGTPPCGAYNCHSFSSYKLKVVCSRDYMQDKHTISMRQLCSEKLLLREKGSAIRDTLDSTIYLSGYTVHPIWTSVNSMALIKAAMAGLGITILPELLVQDALENGTLVSLKIEDMKLENELTAVWHKNKYMTESFRFLLSCFDDRGVKTPQKRGTRMTTEEDNTKEIVQDTLWELITNWQGKTFYTVKLLPFTYRIKGGELFTDRRERSITKSTFEKAFQKIRENPEKIKGPKALNMYGAPYVWAVLKGIGAIGE